ncbi:hypothetical protein [Bacteroides acidifaciens]|uniref:hypothetical protein n=1 Tax=Bacteroides acidifaciens TaxID=85831 RepID=UPI00263AC1E1|nr:hypothetical protein [Bacteroides acidifaciens]
MKDYIKNQYVRTCNNSKFDGCEVEGLRCNLSVINSKRGEELFNHIFEDISGKTLSDILEELYGKKNLHLPLTKDDVDDLAVTPNGEVLSLGYTDPIAVFMDIKTEQYVVSPCVYAATLEPESDHGRAMKLTSDRIIETKEDAELNDGEIYIYPYDFIVWNWCAMCYFKTNDKKYYYNATNTVIFKDFVENPIESISETHCFLKRAGMEEE